MLPVRRGVTVPALSATGTTTSPAATQVGDLVVVFVWSQNTAIPTHTLQANFVEVRPHPHDDGTTDGRASCAYKIATVAGAQSYQPYAITGANTAQINVACVVYEAGTFDVSTLPTSNSTSLTTNAVPNPPSVAALTGDFQILAVGFWHSTTSAAHAATTMTNYAIIGQNAAAAHLTHMAIAARDLASLSNATEDPGVFASDNLTPNGSVSMTVAIKGFTLAARTGTGDTTAAAQLSEAVGTSAIAGTSLSLSASHVVESAGAVAETGAGSSTSSPQTDTTIGTAGITGTGTTTSAAQISAGTGTVDDPTLTGTGASTAALQESTGSGTAAIAGMLTSSSSPHESTSIGAVVAAGIGATCADAQIAESVGASELAGVAATVAAVQTSAQIAVAAIAGELLSAAAAQVSIGAGTTDDAPDEVTGTGETVNTTQATSGTGVVAITGVGASTAAPQIAVGPLQSIEGASARVIDEARASATFVSSSETASIVSENYPTATVIEDEP